MAMTGGSELGDGSGTVVAAQPLLDVVVRTVQEVSGTTSPTRVVSDHEGQAQSPTALECC